MHSVCLSSQVLVSMLFIAVPADTESSKLILDLFVYFFYVIIASYAHNSTHAVFIFHRQNISMVMIWWLGYVNCNNAGSLI